MSDFTSGATRSGELAGGLLLLGCTATALILANSPLSDAYFNLWHRPLTVGSDPAFVTKSVKQWIDDGLMAVFFLLVGLEIKRELVSGELQSRSQAMIPIAAAAGGVLLPAVIYLAITAGTPAARGWAIPVATDIAFALGILALLGNRVTPAVRVFLVSLAIVDDIFAVAIIALFYGHGINGLALGSAGVILLVLIGINLRNVRHLEFYLLLGLALWVAVFASGLHATLAGVLLALCIPADDDPGFQEMESPLERLEHRLYGVVTFGIVPLFALANAGVSLSAGALAIIDWRITIAIVLALVVGKPLGILIGVRAVGAMGGRRSVGAPVGVALLGGVGFTMSLFIAGLSFENPVSLMSAKIGILAGSLIAGGAGWWLLHAASRPRLNGKATVIPFRTRSVPPPPVL